MNRERFINAANALALINAVVGTINGLSEFSRNVPSIKSFFASITYSIGKVFILSFFGFTCILVTLILLSLVIDSGNNTRSHISINKKILLMAIFGGCLIGLWQTNQSVGCLNSYPYDYYSCVSFFGTKIPVELSLVRGLGAIIMFFSVWFFWKTIKK